jgi:DNA mismatch repair ATPase MutS
MEQYVSLANFSYQHPSFIYPEINNDEKMQAIGLFHPLIHGNIIANTLELGQQEQVILLTGANMTGKSTWLRAIGLNAVLAYSGLPIAAKSACLPLMHIYTSMRITDDLEEGISYFKAEITRLQTLLTSIRLENSKWLVLLDEPLRGTNSGDKQAGTIGLIKNLLNLPAIGILATHDAALSVLEIQYPGKISNYHFDSSISGNELTFDYTLKSGCSTSNNATTLMRLNGILLDET